MDKEVIDPDFSKTTEGTIFKKTLGDMEDKTVGENTEIIWHDGYNRSRDRSMRRIILKKLWQ